MVKTVFHQIILEKPGHDLTLKKNQISRWKRPKIYHTVIGIYLSFISALILLNLISILLSYQSGPYRYFDDSFVGMRIHYDAYVIPEIIILFLSLSSSILLFYQRPIGTKISLATLIFLMVIFLVFGLISFDFSTFEEDWEYSIPNILFSFSPTFINSVMIWFLILGLKTPSWG